MSSLCYAQGFGHLYHFAEENREIITQLPEVSPLATPNFHLNQQQSDQVAAITALDREIDAFAYAPNLDDCLDNSESEQRLALREEIEDRSLRFYFSLTYSGPETYDRLDHIIERDTYSAFITRSELSGQHASLPSRNFNTLVAQYERRTGKSLDELTPLERTNALESYLQDNFDLAVPRDFLIEENLRQAMINDPQNWRQATRGLQDELNFDQKMRIAARMGSTFLGNYNNNRAADGPDGEIVSMEQLLAAAANNNPGGICRDISFAQAQLLQELGVNKDSIYALSYATPGTYHSVLIVRDPNDPDNLVKLNYGQMTQDGQGIGPEALRQYTSLPDVGINYRLYDADARPVGRMPSELGQILRDVTNARHSLIQTQPYNLARVAASDGHSTVSLFSGTTSVGDEIVGASYVRPIPSTPYSESEIGLAIVRHNIDSPTIQMEQNLLYARIRTEFQTGDIRFGDRVTLRGNAGMEADIVYGYHEGQRSNGNTVEGDTLDFSNEVFAGVTSVYESPNGSTITATGQAYFYPDFSHQVRADGYTLAFDRAEASVTYETPLSPDVRALAEAGIVIRQYGEAAYMRGAFEGLGNGNHDYSAFATYTTPLSDDTPSFMPERERQLNIGTEHSLDNGWNFNLGLERSIDADRNRGFMYIERRF